MITSYFGKHGIGGDAVFVDRLSRALLRRGHDVHVIYNEDAFDTVRGHAPNDAYVPPAGLQIHALRSGIGRFGPLYTHQTGRLGNYADELRTILRREQFEVIHLHNIALIGGMEILRMLREETQAVKLMTAGDHWLLCPLSKLWQFDSEPCEKPDCIRCTLATGRAPQLWRFNGRLPEALNELDALLFPSTHAQTLHEERGIDLPQASHLSTFLPDDWADGVAAPLDFPRDKPYFMMAGRLVKEKGFQGVVSLMSQLPHARLMIAGEGVYEPELRQLATKLENVHFLGKLDAPQMAQLMRGARGLIVPSLFFETVGTVVMEAFSQATPVLVRNRGALPEWVNSSGGGMVFDTSAELLDQMNFWLEKPKIAQRMGLRGAHALRTFWTESQHIASYIDVIRSTQLRRDVELV